MPSEPMPERTNADRPTSESLSDLQARQAALIKRGQELMRELDELTAKIAQRQSNRDEATARWNKG